MDKKYSKNNSTLNSPHFSWGGTTPEWEKEATQVIQILENKEEKEKPNQENQTFYLRDRN